jgi:AcrR family transcriptional regulator
MDKRESLTRNHIVDVAAKMVTEVGSDAFRIVDLADRANIGVPTIYYHFTSRAQVIAEAQMANYAAMTEPLHGLLSTAETAASLGDEEAFWSSVETNIERAWDSGQFDEKLGIVRLLLDIWADEKTRTAFRRQLDVQFARWIALVRDAQAHGWIEPELDAAAIVGLFWAASVGQLVTSGSPYVEISPAAMAEFFRRLMREKRTLPRA